MQVNQSYGLTRPAAIAAKVAALQARFAPVALIEVPTAPVLALVPAAPSKAERVAQMQAERAGLRADLPFMRHYAANFDDGPTFAEIEALEQRLADLDDYLILEPDFTAQMPLALAA